MTRDFRDRILKEANGNITDHLRNHIHLTNCIHLKNHMHKHSPVMADRSLMRDLVVLQRSRSLRDPSASPSSWQSPSIIDLLSKKLESGAMVREARRSTGMERRRDGKMLPSNSPMPASQATSKVAPDEQLESKIGLPTVSDRSYKSGGQAGIRANREEPSQKSINSDCLAAKKESWQDSKGNALGFEFVGRNSGGKGRKVQKKAKGNQDVRIKTLSEQLGEVRVDSDEATSSHIHIHGRPGQQEINRGGLETGTRGYSSGLNRGKRRKFRSSRRNQVTGSSREIGAQNELSVASNSIGQEPGFPKHHAKEVEEEYASRSVTGAPNGCGIPWNWSRIHNRSKTFLDIAGRSLSCGLADPRLKREGAFAHGRDTSDMPVASDRSISPTESDAEALPLLVEASGSQSSENAAWVHDYSGELGIYADNLLKNDIDSDLASEGRSGGQGKFRGQLNSRHQNLTQKYMPKTFKDLVGQNLVSQALSNAISRRKVGLLYVFYGPHGTGKTSSARLFAKALNCQSLEQPKPCGSCNSCNSYGRGQSRNIKEVGPVSNFDFESIMDILDHMVVSQLSSLYRVFIFDDCDTLSPECWSAISKVIDRAPRRVVFVLVCSSLDILPHVVISRCQKFFFPKLKDADIIYTLQKIATKEDLEIDKDALKLIASRSDGSLRDAEMTLEQLSLLGQRITVLLVQELVGLVSDEKLVDLLDLAISADTVNTVKNLREIMETGVEPLALMSQLATVITDILAGIYDFSNAKRRRKFFRQQPLSKEDMEKLRQALKTLSEAEKQLRMSNDKLTWLTAAMLQLAPDHQYMLPGSSADVSFNPSPAVPNAATRRDIGHRSFLEQVVPHGRGLSTNNKNESLKGGTPVGPYDIHRMKSSTDRRKPDDSLMAARQPPLPTADTGRTTSRLSSAKNRKEMEDIWLEVLQKIRINGIKQFLYQEGELISVSFGAAPTVQLMFSSYATKSKAEKFMGYILQAFESILESSVTIEIRCDPRNDARDSGRVPIILPASDGRGTLTGNRIHRAGREADSRSVPRDTDNANGYGFTQGQLLLSDSRGKGSSEIVEIAASPRKSQCNEHAGDDMRMDRRVLEGTTVGKLASPHRNSSTSSLQGRRKIGEQNQSRSIVKGKVSLAHVIQQAEGCPRRGGWSARKAVSIAEKLEQENLKLEPRSRSLLCWKASRATRRKLTRLRIRTRRPKSLLKFVSCGKCLTVKSPR